MSKVSKHWDEFNPWRDAIVYVPLKELAECHAGIGENYTDIDGSSKPLTVERVLEWWNQKEGPLDAYILPQPSGYHDMGVRYGAEGSQYLSPAADEPKLRALLAKYSPAPARSTSK